MEHNWPLPWELLHKEDSCVEIVLNLFSYRGVNLPGGVTVARVCVAFGLGVCSVVVLGKVSVLCSTND